MRYVIVFLCGLLFAATAAAEDGYRATYKLVVGFLTVGKMERSYDLQADGAYRFESKLWSTGLVSIVRKDELLETSSGTLQEGSYYPDYYTYLRRNKKKPRDIRMHFDRKNANIKTVINGDTLSAPLREGLLDKLVYQAALMHDLSAGKTEFNYRIADRGKEKTYQPLIGEQAIVETKLGRFDTFKIIRQSKKDKRQTIFWCAADLGYLPVRVTYREKDGTETTALLTSYRRL
jgi:hypothetical protein